MSWDDSWAQQEKERLLFFLWGLSQWKAMDSGSTLTFPTSLSSLQSLSFPYCGGLASDSPWLEIPSCNSLPIPNQPIFFGEIPGSLFGQPELVGKLEFTHERGNQWWMWRSDVIWLSHVLWGGQRWKQQPARGLLLNAGEMDRARQQFWLSSFSLPSAF